jgi:hypothetical protein
MTMSKRITGVFETRDSGQLAAQSLLQHQIAPERLYILAGASAAAGENENQVGTGEATGTLVGAGLTGLITFAVPGIGILLGAATAIATLGLAAAADDTTAPDRPVELEQMLVKLGFMPEQARGYADDVRQGRTLLTVDAEDAQTDLIADVLHRYGGYKLEFRRTEV